MDIQHVTVTFVPLNLNTVIIFTKLQVWTRSTYPFVTYNVFTPDTLRQAVTLTFDAMTLNMCNVSAVT